MVDLGLALADKSGYVTCPQLSSDLTPDLLFLS